MAAVVDSVAVVWSRVGEDAADLLTSLRTCLALMSGSLGLPLGVPESPSSGTAPPLTFAKCAFPP